MLALENEVFDASSFNVGFRDQLFPPSDLLRRQPADGCRAPIAPDVVGTGQQASNVQFVKARRLILQRLQWAEANSELLLAAETWRV